MPKSKKQKYLQAYYAKNHKRIRAAWRHRYHTDPEFRERRREQHRKYRRRHRKALREIQRRYRKKNREIILARARAAYLAKRGGVLLKRGRRPMDPARARVILKLHRGKGLVGRKELKWVLPAKRAEAKKSKPRSMQAIGDLFGLTSERIRRILKPFEIIGK
jgi:hypothetical protein